MTRMTRAIAFFLISVFTPECEMSTTYTPDPTNDPADITIPSDGDGPGIKAADVNPAFEGLADQIAARRMKRDVFLTSGTWTCPVGVTVVMLEGVGGGGGGGGGAGGGTVTSRQTTGGGGGGGALMGHMTVAVTPGTVYAVTVGAGGAGGAAGGASADGTAGSDGNPSIFRVNPASTILGVFAGASHGGGGTRAPSTATDAAIAFGGPNVDTNGHYDNYAGTQAIMSAVFWSRQSAIPIGRGGDAPANVNSETTGGSGGSSLEGFDSPTGGANGTDSGSYKAGCGGGSGGAGPFSAAGANAGGAGGNGNNAGAGVAGSAGTAGQANSGEGGGGGGGGGSGTSGSSGGAGAAGGSGRMIIIYQGAQAVVT